MGLPEWLQQKQVYLLSKMKKKMYKLDSVNAKRVSIRDL